jgi:S1-C subfamily serine protease
MTRTLALSCAAMLTVVFAVPATVWAEEASVPKQPRMGFEGHLVDISNNLPAGENVPSLGMQIDGIKRGGPAWKMGLEKGDIIVSIDAWRFTTNKGYLQALRAAGQRPSIIVIDSRAKKLVRRPCSLPHAEPSAEDLKPKKPDSFMMGITLEDDLKQNGP